MTYRFGPFALDRDARQLLADGAEVHLSPKSFTLLLMLIEHRQRVVSKEELQRALWPSTFVGETNLPTLASELRRALADSPGQPVWIRTIHRVGYRFVGPVTETPSIVPSRPDGRMQISTPSGQILLVEGPSTIGRGSDAAIRIDAGGVSRHHARILVCAGQAAIEDLGSKNGTYVQGMRIEGVRQLEDGDEIRVGPVRLTFRLLPSTLATETMGEAL